MTARRSGGSNIVFGVLGWPLEGVAQRTNDANSRAAHAKRVFEQPSGPPNLHANGCAQRRGAKRSKNQPCLFLPYRRHANDCLFWDSLSFFSWRSRKSEKHFLSECTRFSDTETRDSGISQTGDLVCRDSTTKMGGIVQNYRNFFRARISLRPPPPILCSKSRDLLLLWPCCLCCSKKGSEGPN